MKFLYLKSALHNFDLYFQDNERIFIKTLDVLYALALPVICKFLMIH